MTVAGLIVAAGRGVRSGEGPPKQFRLLAGRSVLARVIDAFARHPRIDLILIVVHPDHHESARIIVEAAQSARPILLASGGDTRQMSVLSGLEALAAKAPRLVIVHDGARPFASPALIDRAIAGADAHGAAVPALQLTDTLVRVGEDGRIDQRPDRNAMRAIQTPQAFQFDLLLSAHRAASKNGRTDYTDDGAVMLAAGHAVHVFEGERENVKLTWPEDFADAERRLNGALITRVASGYDVHACGTGDHVWLGGARIAHTQSLVGHSDADVGLHALTDALLGAACDGDIGSHFPPSDPQWRGASSDRFLAFAANRIREMGGVIDHLDLTIVCETPKIGPHRDAMRTRVAEIARVPLNRVSVKATTSERLGFTGRGEGIAAYATVTVRLPERDDR